MRSDIKTSFMKIIFLINIFVKIDVALLINKKDIILESNSTSSENEYVEVKNSSEKEYLEVKNSNEKEYVEVKNSSEKEYVEFKHSYSTRSDNQNVFNPISGMDYWSTGVINPHGHSDWIAVLNETT